MRTRTKQPTQMDTAKFVRAILERNRRPDAQVEDLVIQYTCRDSIGRLEPSDELVHWTATLELPLYDEDFGTTSPAVIATATFLSFDILDSRWDPMTSSTHTRPTRPSIATCSTPAGTCSMSWSLERPVHDSSSWTVYRSIGIGAATGSVPSLLRALFASRR